MKQNLLESR